ATKARKTRNEQSRDQSVPFQPVSCYRGSTCPDSDGKKIVVAGCLVERYGNSLKRKFPDVDLWVPLADMPRIASLLAASSKPQASSRVKSSSCTLHHASCTATPRVLSTPKHFAYLKIADGCDNRCSYCMIPDIRGPFRSRPLDDITEEARALARIGVKELILIAQDTTLYGTDIYRKPSLARLLTELERVEGIRWLRLMYTHPAHLTEDVIDQFASNPRLCRYIDLPIQHIADHLLAKMNRCYTRQDVELLLESLRAIPDMHIRTTIIVGLPGETARDFEELLAFVRAARFDRLSCYAYSPEPGTKAARLPGQVFPTLKKERVRRLMLAQAAVSRANLKKLVGRRLTVLVDTREDNRQERQGHQVTIGRTQWDAPEIDGVVKLSGRNVRPGTLVHALVTGSTTHDITAVVV
ncbi:30S ribosomal protein S12 methylthiotransferase RimO, partial [candidate division WOR-3 bacterium]|nr:30S ribosomal protein S12 methylthiotransferase RimO [candidate division WOR-3 bacterium]